jgi:fructokinase
MVALQILTHCLLRAFIHGFELVPIIDRTMKFAAIEGGGQSWVVGMAEDSPDNIIEREVIVTTDPVTTLTAIRIWLSTREFDSIGIACFGPIDAKEGSPTFGFITSTPKPGWVNTDVLGLLGMRGEYKHIPFKFDTDVNAPAYAEFVFHGKAGATSCAYITVGTGVGVGLVVNGATTIGLVHPEAGHIQVPRFKNDTFSGTCPYHGSCVEGMCSSGALAARHGCSMKDLPSLPDDDPIWDYFAYYLAQLCSNLILIASPEHITIGGGIMKRTSLFPRVRCWTATIINDYLKHSSITTQEIDQYISPSTW